MYGLALLVVSESVFVCVYVCMCVSSVCVHARGSACVALIGSGHGAVSGACEGRAVSGWMTLTTLSDLFARSDACLPALLLGYLLWCLVALLLVLTLCGGTRWIEVRGHM